MIEYAAVSGKGCVRGGNEDNYYVKGRFHALEAIDEEVRLQGGCPEAEGLFAVCDGMGGHDAGEIASTLAAGSLKQLEADLSSSVSAVSLIAWTKHVNGLICREAPGSGSTLVLLYFGSGRVYPANLGDSRAYLLRGGALARLTEDHSEVARLLRIGAITEEEARTHPDLHAIYRHFGMADSRRCEPQLYPPLEPRPGDVFLICSDGVTDMVPDGALQEMLDSGGSAAELAERIYQEALRRGGEDNTTAVVIRVPYESAQPEDKEDMQACP